MILTVFHKWIVKRGLSELMSIMAIKVIIIHNQGFIKPFHAHYQPLILSSVSYKSVFNSCQLLCRSNTNYGRSDLSKSASFCARRHNWSTNNIRLWYLHWWITGDTTVVTPGHRYFIDFSKPNTGCHVFMLSGSETLPQLYGLLYNSRPAFALGMGLLPDT